MATDLILLKGTPGAFKSGQGRGRPIFLKGLEDCLWFLQGC
jgi:hypothetical protein